MTNIKIAVPTKEKMVDGHFGHCENFTIYSVDEKRNIINEELYEPAAGCGCKSNLAGIFQQQGVKILLAGGIGQGAINILNQHGIEVYRGCSGDARILTEEFLKGNVSDTGETCSHPHHHGHGDHDGECHHN